MCEQTASAETVVGQKRKKKFSNVHVLVCAGKLRDMYRTIYYGKTRVDYAPFNQHERFPWKDHHYTFTLDIQGTTTSLLVTIEAFG